MPDFEGTMEFPTNVVTSRPVIAINRNITSCVLNASGNGVGSLLFELSANNGNNWEQVNLNQTYTFANTGSILRWRAFGMAGNTITYLQISGVVFA